MNESLPIELLERLEQMPENPVPSSKLEPFREVILRWRRQGRSYRQIQVILKCECSLPVAYETLRRFVQRRLRPRKTSKPELVTETLAVKPYQPTFEHSHPSGKTRAEMLAFLAQEKAKPLVPKPVIEKLFEYTDEDASKPIKTISEGELV